MIEFIIELSLLLIIMLFIYKIFESNKIFTMLIFTIMGVSLWYLWYLMPMYAFSIAGSLSLIIALMSKPQENTNDLYQALKNLSKHRNSIKA